MTARRVVEFDAFTNPLTFVGNCSASDAVNDCVYISGDSINGNPRVSKADVTLASKMPAIGVISEKFTTTTCNVVYLGVLTLIGLTPGSFYFVGADSTLTSVRPVGPAFIQVIGLAIDSTRLLVNPSYNMTRVL